jgi:hypothetical protein
MLAILLPLPNLRATNKVELHVTKAFSVEGQPVPAGDYTLECDGSNSAETFRKGYHLGKEHYFNEAQKLSHIWCHGGCNSLWKEATVRG